MDDRGSVVLAGELVISKLFIYVEEAQLLFIPASSLEEATNLPGVVATRDSKSPDGPKLLVSAAGWRAFVRGLKSANMPRGFQPQCRCAEGG